MNERHATTAGSRSKDQLMNREWTRWMIDKLPNDLRARQTSRQATVALAVQMFSGDLRFDKAKTAIGDPSPSNSSL